MLLRDGITLRKVVGGGGGYIRLARNPFTGDVYLLNPVNGLYRVELAVPGSTLQVVAMSDIITDGAASGMAFGPDAVQYRGDDGHQHDVAAEGKPLYTFTPHRSPLGLVFTTDARMPADLRGDSGSLSAFVLSWGAAGGSFSDQGQDLLHLRLAKRGEDYESVTTQIARRFKNPIDAVMIENRLYVLEYGADGAIWELTFE